VDGQTDVPLRFVLTSDLAGYLAAAVDADISPAERVDIGWGRPVSMREAARLISNGTGKTIKVRAVPSALTRAAGAVIGRFVQLVKDMAAMFRWFDTGRYVADTTRQPQLFGPAPQPKTPSPDSPPNWAPHAGDTGRGLSPRQPHRPQSPPVRGAWRRTTVPLPGLAAPGPAPKPTSARTLWAWSTSTQTGHAPPRAGAYRGTHFRHRLRTQAHRRHPPAAASPQG
jgi:hypothetical protein